MSFIKFIPFYDEFVWGGVRLQSMLKRPIPNGKPIGESREIYDRSDESSTVAEGAFAGYTLRKLILEKSDYLMGPKWNPEKYFPLIIKWLDCEQRLSLQVHPDERAAKMLGSEEKNEAWYFYRTQPFSKFVAGLKPNMTKQKLLRDIEHSQLTQSLVFNNSAAGDFVEINGGCLHSLGAGNLLLEVQQNSRTTYRLYDWNRIGLDGNPRKLHIKEALESIDFDAPAPKKHHENFEELRLLCSNKAFSMTKRTIKRGETYSVRGGIQPRIICALNGALFCDKKLVVNFDTVLLPYAEHFKFTTDNFAEFIVIENFI